MGSALKRNSLVLSCVIAVLAGCGTTSGTPARVNEDNAAKIGRQIGGTSLIGAKGATPKDQNAIDETAAGFCGVGSWTPSECARHREEVRK